MIQPRLFISRVIVGLCGIFFAIITAEVVLHLIPFDNSFELIRLLEQQWESDDELLLHLKPDLNLDIKGHPDFRYTVRTNADGLRDEAFVGHFDIAAIGDSFTFGFGVEGDESWPAILENLSGKRVANLGWAGWNSHVYPTTISRYAIPLNTSIWLWAFFNNDLLESVEAEAFLSSGQTDYLAQKKNSHNQTDAPFFINSRLAQFLAIQFNPQLRLLPDSGDKLYDDGNLRMLVSHYPWETTAPDNPLVARGWQLSEAALLKAQNLANEHDAILIVLYIPSREHVYWPLIKDILNDVDVKQLDDVETRLANYCQTHNIPYLNLLPEMQERALQARQMFYFPSDGHWNQHGHQLAAELIYEFLLQKELLGP